MTRLVTVEKITDKWLDYIERFTGDRPEDWLSEEADYAFQESQREWCENYTPEEKIEYIDDYIGDYAWMYIDHIKENYPERMKEEW